MSQHLIDFTIRIGEAHVSLLYLASSWIVIVDWGKQCRKSFWWTLEADMRLNSSSLMLESKQHWKKRHRQLGLSENKFQRLPADACACPVAGS